MDLDVFFAGTGGSVPTARRGMPALLVRRGGEKLLFDCGEGTQRQLVRSVGLPEVDEILLTHFHADHWLGLPGMLKTFDLRDRERPLTVRGPRGLRELMQVMRVVYGRVRYDLTIEEVEPGAEVRRDGYTLAAVSVQHRIPALAWVLWEDERPGEFDAAAAERLGVAPGPDFGRLQRGEPVGEVRPEEVVGPARAGRKIVVSGDTAPCDSVRIAAHGADVLVHEATFTEEARERAAQTGHSTAGDAAALARDAEVRLLALTHVSTRYGGHEIRDEARAVFEQTIVPQDFDRVELPFPERGGPVHVRADASG